MTNINSNKTKITIFWYRRDLRLHDNAGLYHALCKDTPVLPLFIFDTDILDNLQNKKDARVTFIYNTILSIKENLKKQGSDLLVKIGNPETIWQELLKEYEIEAVYANHDYESYALERDAAVKTILHHANIVFHTFKDQVIFEKREILSGQETPYTVFTPYSKAWRAKCNSYYLSAYPTEKYFQNLHQNINLDLPSIEAIGFEKEDVLFPTINLDLQLLENYDKKRNFPAVRGTSRLGIHLRFGTVSIRALVRQAYKSSNTWLNELIWRDFYQQILSNFPHIGEGHAFRPAYDRIHWRNNELEFDAWCQGNTGYPLVDAGMRELNQTGFMHNRVRMVTASFLTKHLLIDWRWGESYFAEKLLDFDFAANNGGWQWAAGSGTDAAPYFRIFNPTTQAIKFDQHLEYIKKWIPEINSLTYPMPIVDHKFARERCLRVYKEALSQD